MGEAQHHARAHRVPEREIDVPRFQEIRDPIVAGLAIDVLQIILVAERCVMFPASLGKKFVKRCFPRFGVDLRGEKERAVTNGLVLKNKNWSIEENRPA